MADIAMEQRLVVSLEEALETLQKRFSSTLRSSMPATAVSGGLMDVRHSTAGSPSSDPQVSIPRTPSPLTTDGARENAREDSVLGNDLVPQMDFPQFDGEDASTWLDKCAAYFTLYNIPEYFRVTAATLHLSGQATQWFQSCKDVVGILDWDQFRQAVLTEFEVSAHKDQILELLTLKQSGSVEDFRKDFESLVYHIRLYENNLSDTFLVTQFVHGLKHELRALVELQMSESVSNAACLASKHEKLLGNQSATHLQQGMVGQAIFSGKGADNTLSQGDVRKAEQPKKYIRSNVLCFNCGEKCMHDNKCKIAGQPQLNCISVDESSDGGAVIPDILNLLESSETNSHQQLSFSLNATGSKNFKCVNLRAPIQNQGMAPPEGEEKADESEVFAVHSTVQRQSSYDTSGMPATRSMKCLNLLAPSGWVFMVIECVVFDPGTDLKICCNGGLLQPWPPPFPLEILYGCAMIRPLPWPSFGYREASEHLRSAATVIILPSNQCSLWQQQQQAVCQYINFNITAYKHIILMYCTAHMLFSIIEFPWKCSYIGNFIDALCSGSKINSLRILASVSHDELIISYRIDGCLEFLVKGTKGPASLVPWPLSHTHTGSRSEILVILLVCSFGILGRFPALLPVCKFPNWIGTSDNGMVEDMGVKGFYWQWLFWGLTVPVFLLCNSWHHETIWAFLSSHQQNGVVSQSYRVICLYQWVLQYHTVFFQIGVKLQPPGLPNRLREGTSADIYIAPGSFESIVGIEIYEVAVHGFSANGTQTVKLDNFKELEFQSLGYSFLVSEIFVQHSLELLLFLRSHHQSGGLVRRTIGQNLMLFFLVAKKMRYSRIIYEDAIMCSIPAIIPLPLYTMGKVWSAYDFFCSWKPP